MASIEKAREIRRQKEFVSVRKAWEVLSALGKPHNVSDARSRKEAANELYRMTYEKDVAVYIHYEDAGRQKVSKAKDEPIERSRGLNMASLDGTNELDNLFANLSFIGQSDEGRVMGAYAPEAMERFGFDPLELSACLTRNLGYDEGRMYKKLTGLTHPEHDTKTRASGNAKQGNGERANGFKDDRNKDSYLKIISAMACELDIKIENERLSGLKRIIFASQLNGNPVSKTVVSNILKEALTRFPSLSQTGQYNRKV